MSGMVKILFVDDEPAIRLSVPAILQMHGFEVVSAGTVSEALHQISHKSFDVLISDLNIGNPGDGFTVVSAMRRTQPNCVTLILTGFPAFETALQAIRSQVDDYLIKPAGADKLVAAIEEHLRVRRPHTLVPLKSVGTMMEENAVAIADRIVEAERHILQLPRVHLTEPECRASAELLVRELARHLDCASCELSPQLVDISITHGRSRFEQGYSASMLVEENRLFCAAILESLQDNLLVADVSNLIPDLKELMNILGTMLREAIVSHSAAARAA